jgi:hypothetical protein
MTRIKPRLRLCTAFVHSLTGLSDNEFRTGLVAGARVSKRVRDFSKASLPLPAPMKPRWVAAQGDREIQGLGNSEGTARTLGSQQTYNLVNELD